MCSVRTFAFASRRSAGGCSVSALPIKFDVETQEEFRRAVYLERRRSERSGRPLLLILLDADAAGDEDARIAILEAIGANLRTSLRETDKLGWYKMGTALGVLFPDLPGGSRDLIRTLIRKVSGLIGVSVDSNAADMIQVIAYLFPNPFHPESNGDDFTLYPELAHKEGLQQLQNALKRTIDVLASLTALVLFSPLFVVIAVAIKCSSLGPVLFKQKRVGQYGKLFTFLKFRSMYADSDSYVHQQYVKELIANKTPATSGIYKLTNDPRITPLGRVLRKTSLDELPQFWNVLLGSMSLVGPRPPIPYESKNYSAWHRRRTLEAKPGITGLWQVSGRSRTTFDEMVRLDLKYVRQRSLWLDLKILLQTPGAVVSGGGAF